MVGYVPLLRRARSTRLQLSQDRRRRAREEIDPLMSSSRTITLFSERPEVSQRPTSFLVSLAAHAAVVFLLSVGIIYNPDKNDRIVAKRYTVRSLDLHTLPDQARPPGNNDSIRPHGPTPACPRPRPPPSGGPAPDRQRPKGAPDPDPPDICGTPSDSPWKHWSRQ